MFGKPKTVTKDMVLGALKTVQEPELHKDLVTLNMVKDIEVNDGDVSFTITLTTPACPLRNQIESEAQAAVTKLPGVRQVNVKFDAQVRADNRITRDVADKALAMLDVDRHGLDEMDKRILSGIIGKFGGGPVGINTIAVSVGEEPDTIEEVYEPYLIQQGLLARTPQGRTATAAAYRLLNLRLGPGAQQELL